MKQNKFIYLIIFALVFLGFTNGVKAGVCCYNDGGEYKPFQINGLPLGAVNEFECYQIKTQLNLNIDFTWYEYQSGCTNQNNSSGSTTTNTTTNTTTSTTTNTTNYKCCYKENGIWKFTTSLNNSQCAAKGNGSTSSLNSQQCYAKNDEGKVCCKNGENTGKAKDACSQPAGEVWILADQCKTTQNVQTDTCVYDPDLATKEQCNSHSSQGYSWDDQNQCCRLKTDTQAPSSQVYTPPTNDVKVCCNSEGTVNAQINNEEVCKEKGMSWVSKDQCSAPSNTSDPDGNSAGNGSTNATSGSTGNETITIGFDCNDENVASIIKTVKIIYNLLRLVTPIILIIMGSVDLLRATIAGKDDEIEKHKKVFINRLYLAAIIFLLLSVFQLTTNILERAGVTNSNSWVECWNHINEK